MACLKLLHGLDVSCRETRMRFYQNLVLINRADVDQFRTRSTQIEHKILFNLMEGASGVLFKGNDSSDVFQAWFTKTTENDVPMYEHRLQLPITGNSEAVKSLLMRLDAGDYFAAIMYQSGEIEIYGFDNGLTTGGYSYEPQSGIGGAVIPLVSNSNEYRPPYLYSGGGNEAQHYRELFANVGQVIGGDFNDDFNDDFDNVRVDG